MSRRHTETRRIIDLILLILLLVTCYGEFIICFARGYEELWYTILVPAIIDTILVIIAYRFRVEWVYLIATVVIITLAVLMIGFPSYIMYLALIGGGASLILEIILLILHIRDRHRPIEN